jgi:hypothetical protein
MLSLIASCVHAVLSSSYFRDVAVPSAYLTKSNTVAPVLEAIVKAGIPERFTYEFLAKQLGFTSSSDRPVIAVLKALRFLDDSGVPLERYRRYRDPTHSQVVLAEALRDAYADVFAGDQRANEQTTTQLKGVFARISGKGEAVSQKMAATFKTLCDLADFTGASGPMADEPVDEPATDAEHQLEERQLVDAGAGARMTLRHDIHIHLPESTEIAVYDAIFRSIRSNLAS